MHIDETKEDGAERSDGNESGDYTNATGRARATMENPAF